MLKYGILQLPPLFFNVGFVRSSSTGIFHRNLPPLRSPQGSARNESTFLCEIFRVHSRNVERDNVWKRRPRVG